VKALILAAGRGSRLGSVGDTRPKCLVEAAGRALLDWQIDALHAAGIERVGLVDGYLGERIVRPGLRRFTNERWANTGIVASLACARDWLAEGPTVVAYADILYHPRIVAALVAAPGDVVVACDLDWQALWQARFSDPLVDAEAFRFRGDRLLAIGGRAATVEEIEAQYLGLVKWTAVGARLLERTLAACPAELADRIDMTSLLSRMLAAGEDIRCAPVHGHWCEVDSAADLALYQRLAATAGWHHDWRT